MEESTDIPSSNTYHRLLRPDFVLSEPPIPTSNPVLDFCSDGNGQLLDHDSGQCSPQKFVRNFKHLRCTTLAQFHSSSHLHIKPLQHFMPARDHTCTSVAPVQLLLFAFFGLGEDAVEAQRAIGNAASNAESVTVRLTTRSRSIRFLITRVLSPPCLLSRPQPHFRASPCTVKLILFREDVLRTAIKSPQDNNQAADKWPDVELRCQKASSHVPQLKFSPLRCSSEKQPVACLCIIVHTSTRTKHRQNCHNLESCANH